MLSFKSSSLRGDVARVRLGGIARRAGAMPVLSLGTIQDHGCGERTLLSRFDQWRIYTIYTRRTAKPAPGRDRVAAIHELSRSHDRRDEAESLGIDK